MGNDAAVDLFEVYKIGTIGHAQLDSLSLTQIQETYTEILPITSLEQLEQATALAQIPCPGHVIVDRNQFKDMLIRQATDMASQRTSVAITQMDDAINNVKHLMAQEVISTLECIIDSMKTDFTTIKSKLNKEWNQIDEKYSKCDLFRLKVLLDEAMVHYQDSISRLFDLVISKQDKIQSQDRI